MSRDRKWDHNAGFGVRPQPILGGGLGGLGAGQFDPNWAQGAQTVGIVPGTVTNCAPIQGSQVYSAAALGYVGHGG